MSSPRPAEGATAPRSGSWTLPAPEGVYGPLTAWPSAAAWFDAVMDVLRTPEGESARRDARVAPDTLLRVAYADRAAADQTTGRGVATAHETVAVQLGMSAKTVQRCRLLLEALGLAVTVAQGRYLTTAERLQARSVHGGHQLRAASTRALTMPTGYRPPPTSDDAPEDPRAVKNVHLPSRRGVKSSSHLPDNSLTHAHSRARKVTATRRPAETNERAKRSPRGPRRLDIQRLAAGLAARMPWLDRGGAHIGRLCDVVERHGLVERGWTAGTLLDEMSRRARDVRVRMVAVDEQREPLGYFTWLLGATIPDGALAPSQAIDNERRQRAAAQAIEATERAERRAQIEAEAEAIDAVLAEMRRQFPRRRTGRL